MYENEDTLGGAIAASGKPRDSLYITTKLKKVPEGQTPKDLLLDSLKKLKVGEYDVFWSLYTSSTNLPRLC